MREYRWLLLPIPVKVLVGFGSRFRQHGCMNQRVLRLASSNIDCEATASKCSTQNDSAFIAFYSLAISVTLTLFYDSVWHAFSSY